tara:strand:+ start:365 stop:745 length:381 start_codon:yes stop_codon:yes gene_type:complete
MKKDSDSVCRWLMVALIFILCWQTSHIVASLNHDDCDAKIEKLKEGYQQRLNRMNSAFPGMERREQGTGERMFRSGELRQLPQPQFRNGKQVPTTVPEQRDGEWYKKQREQRGKDKTRDGSRQKNN